MTYPRSRIRIFFSPDPGSGSRVQKALDPGTLLRGYLTLSMLLPKKPWVLAHNVHDVGGNDCLVVLALLLFTQAQQILTSYHM